MAAPGSTALRMSTNTSLTTASLTILNVEDAQERFLVILLYVISGQLRSPSVSVAVWSYAWLYGLYGSPFSHTRI